MNSGRDAPGLNLGRREGSYAGVIRLLQTCQFRVIGLQPQRKNDGFVKYGFRNSGKGSVLNCADASMALIRFQSLQQGIPYIDPLFPGVLPGHYPFITGQLGAILI